MNLRPLTSDTPYANRLHRTVNANTLTGGGNLNIEANNLGYTLTQDYPDNGVVYMNYVGEFDISSSYNINDVVRVFPTSSLTSSYVDWDGSPLLLGSSADYISGSRCPISPGLFICVNPVPSLDANISSSIQFYSDYGYIGFNDFRSDGNATYPIYPEIPKSYATTASLSEFIPDVPTGSCAYPVNVCYWEALQPMIKLNVCVDNSSTNEYWVSGFALDKNFNLAYLPYITDDE